MQSSYCENLVDLVWGSARPPRPKNSIFSPDVRNAGIDHAAKLTRVRQELDKQMALITDNVILSVDPEQVSQDVRARLGQELGADLHRQGVVLSYIDTARSPVEELKANGQLEKFRSELPSFEGLSLTTISSTGSNGVIIHYSLDPNDCLIIKYTYADSGGQYLDGTTDVTHSLHFGTPTDEQRRAITRVLQGHIAIDAVIFPNGTSDV
ncbi:hypothetical protein EDB86DRAFT_3133574 [Lactarius hatsudake]|nr:hypothetical protein EDB86DRAFT_3133574 [Lactarius hatsudake]